MAAGWRLDGRRVGGLVRVGRMKDRQGVTAELRKRRARAPHSIQERDVPSLHGAVPTPHRPSVPDAHPPRIEGGGTPRLSTNVPPGASREAAHLLQGSSATEISFQRKIQEELE